MMLGRFSALLALAALVAAPVAHQQQAEADDHEVVIGFAIALSGWMNQYDGPPYQGSLMAIDEFNEQGGILGKQIRAVVSDTKTDTVQGAKAGADVVAQGAQFMVVSCDYDMGAPAATVANSNNMIAISSCASDAKMGVQGIGPLHLHAQHLRPGRRRGAWPSTPSTTGAGAMPICSSDASIEYDKSICHGFMEQWKDYGGTVIGVDSTCRKTPQSPRNHPLQGAGRRAERARIPLSLLLRRRCGECDPPEFAPPESTYPSAAAIRWTATIGPRRSRA